jgi:UDP-glucose 4-epimerase
MISLLEAMKSANVKTLVFSSSATVYGDPQYLPIDEDHPTSAINPYGRGKLYIEEMLKDVANSDTGWKIICLRYFNPVGAHESGLIGEDSSGTPNNIMPYISQVAIGIHPYLNIYGNCYPTPDGTGVRDYIHVMDLAEGHLASLTYLQGHHGWDALNLGTGQGSSILQLVNAYELASGRSISCNITKNRPGDVAASFAAVEKSEALLAWKAKRSLENMCQTSWKWQQKKHFE